MKKVFWIIAAVIFIALVIYFFPYKLSTRLDLDEYKGNKVEGSILFYYHSDDNTLIEINNQSAADELIDYLGSLRGIRSFRGSESPPPDTDHMVDFYLSDKDGNVPLMITITGKSIQTNLNKKFRIFPKHIDMQVIDEMVAEYLVEDIPDFMEPMAYEDVSALADMNIDQDRWVEVQWIDGHSETDRYIVFNGFKPYKNLEVFESGEDLLIFYDEGEGEPGEIVLKVESLPFNPLDTDAKIIFILNGKRSYNVEFVYGKE